MARPTRLLRTAAPCPAPAQAVQLPHRPSPRAGAHREASSSSRLSAWTSALPAAVSSGSRTAPIPTTAGANVRVADPLKLLSSELSFLRQNITSLLGSKHPALDTIAKYYFRAEGKHVRPMIVLLMSQATNGLSPRWNEVQQREADREQARRDGKGMGVDEPLEQEEVLMDENPSMLDRAKDLLRNPMSAFSSSSSPSDPSAASNLLPTQRRLAEITELIHVASLLHDDVIDLAATRRSAPSAPSLFGNKLSILAGDFLLARASLALSRLGSNEVVELVASVLANLVEGEVMQMKGNAASTIVSASSLSGRGPTPEIFEHYMRKTYLKTASLIAKSARATVILGGAGSRQGWVEGEAVKDIAYEYGRNLGIAFQLIDDMLDFTASAAELGKPGGGADLKLGLATAPALYAWDEFPELGELIERKFERDGDVDRAKHLILRSSGAERTFALAEQHSNAAIEALRRLPETDARDALEKIARDVLTRTK
ncbi:terpenoid synthase [Rhodotorula sp. JG-1b]|nr:terpenoid synthase [Rhodotorula sp. JG-1b]